MFALQMAGVFAAYILQVFLARWMGTAEYGKYTYVLSWAAVLAVPSSLGLHISVLRFIPEYRTRGSSDFLYGVVRWSWWLTFGAGIAIALVGFGMATLFASSQYAGVLMLGVWMIPLIALMNLYTGMSRALHRVVVAFLPPLVLRPLLTIVASLALLLALGRLGSQQVVLISLCALLLVVLFQGLWFRRDLLSVVGSARPAYRSRKWLNISGPLLLSVGFDMLIIQTGLLMVGAMSGPTEVGIYNAAVKTALLLSFIAIAVNTVVAPTFASLHSQGRLEELQRQLVGAAHVLFWPSLMLSVLLMAFSDSILGLFGQEFVSARAAMVVLVIGQLIAAGMGAVGRLTDLTGYQRQGVWIRGCSGLLCVALSATLVPFYGILGAAVATAVSLALSSILLHRLATKSLGVGPSILFALSQARAPRT